ncbi:MAG: hypothetical protein QM817_29310 [Archangium sp.]
MTAWLLAARRERRLLAGDFTGQDAATIGEALWRAYERGSIEPRHLERCAERASEFKQSRDLLNRMVCLDIAVGRYREALAWRALEEPPLNDEDRLVMLNQAEALACLGRFEESLRVASLVVETEFVLVAATAHTAWVCCELGRFAEARAALKPLRERAGVLLGAFQAEWYFSSFLVELGEKQWVAAQRALDDAEACTIRESSRRNLWFLRARLARELGHTDEALRFFARGSLSPYRWQGGGALLAWGDLLDEKQRHTEARAVWGQCVERDPQSPAAELARQRLAR